ncbi:MAG: TolC family protein [Deltaproteobacteria bacterium]|nr:TolC family protein [Deltaproteobacteria bacterium]
MRHYVIIVMIGLLFSQGSVQAAERLTLRDCIDTALRSQPTVRAAREGVIAGQGRMRQAASPYLPQLRASAGYSENHSLGGALGDSISKSYTTTLSLNQMLYDFGRTGNALDAARSGTRSAEFDEHRVVSDVVLNVKQAYYALLAARKLVAVSRKTLEQAESHQRQAEAFYHAGSKPKFDVTRAEVEVNTAKLGMINANNSVRIRIIALYNAMGIDPERDIEIEDILSSPPAIPLMEQALAESVRNRPEMLKAEADIQAAQARVKAEESNYLPTLSANGAYNWAHGVSEMGAFSGDIRNSWNAGITLSMPLFEGGLTKGKVSEARANLRILEAQGQTFRQAVLIELNQAYADIESAPARIAVMELSQKKARENLELAQGRYEAGVGPYIEVTDAQLASVNAEINHVYALYDYQLAAARLFKAMGRVEQ